MPAVANAVFHATGVRITDLPVTSEKVLRGLMALRAAEEQAVMAGATKRDDGKESIDV
jgi:hypothetical protein